MRKLLLFFLTAISFNLVAQNTPNAPAAPNTEPAYWLVQKVSVKANTVQAYEANMKQLINNLQTPNNSCAPLNWYTFVSPDQAVYSYVIPVMDFQHLQAIYQEMDTQSSALYQLKQAISSEVNGYDVSLLMPMQSLSKPSESLSAQPFNIIEYLDVTPGQEAAFESILENWAQSPSCSQSGWSVFVTLIGANQPQYSIVYNGASVSSFKNQFNQNSSIEAKQSLSNGDGFGILRSYSWTSNVYAPELSHINLPSTRKSLVQSNPSN